MSKPFVLFLVLVLMLSACGSPAPAVQIPAPPTPAAAPAVPGAPAGQADPAEPAYLRADLPPAERAASLLALMTLDEKIGQMTLVEKDSINGQGVMDFLIGGVLSGGGGTPPQNTTEAWADMVDSFQEGALKTRLGIPILYGVDAVHGHGNLKGAVIFPHNIGLGATGDPDLVRRVAQATAAEMVATNIRWNYAPVVAVGQDIRWGRTYEVFSENTALVSELGTAYLEGLQGSSLADYGSVLATPKHYIGDGGTAWGSSRTGQYKIDQGDMQVDEAALRAVHLPPYQAAVEAGAQSIMVSFSSWNGTKMHAQGYLLTEVLKEELGFEGFLVSDWQAIDQIERDYYKAVVAAINAGIDMNMVPHDYKKFIQTMKSAVQKGDIPQARIDDAVRRILTVKFSMGLFEQPFSDPDLIDQVGSPAHRELAREAVAKSLVLLQNEGDLLPLSTDLPLIFLAGEGADDVGIQSGGWTIRWQGAAGNITPGTTIKDALQAAAQGRVQYNRFGKYDQVLDASGQPAVADVGIVVLSEKPYAEGEGDRADLSLLPEEVALITRVRERSQKVVVVLISGRPLVLTGHLDLAEAWVAAWLPGTEGQGVVDGLFGERPFTGRTPFTWPASMDQLPLGSGRGEPLFPYGFGIQR
jgi:beta-glucosidase